MKKTAIVLSLVSFLLFGANVCAQEEGAYEVTGGKISGYENEDGSVLIFKGIPFAAAPVGDLRWKAPQPVESWEGVKECIEYGPAAIQPEQAPFMMWTEEFIIDTSLGYSEDCLYLNVWAPKAAEKAPVVMFIHGGGNTSGGASCDVYDGEELAKKGVVYVDIGYRVGIFGFLASSELSAESEDGVSGNYALLDQIAALQWIRENIATFGGDPENVTIAGQSAGSLNVNMLTVCPEAAGLFKNAVTMSYNVIDASFPDLATKEAEGDAIFDGRSLEEMRALSAEEVQALSGSELATGMANFNIDGKFVIGNYEDTLLSGKDNDVTVLTGMVTGDSMLFGTFLTGNAFSGTGTEAPVTVEDYEAVVSSVTGDLAELFLAAYPASNEEEVAAALAESTLDMMVAMQEWNASSRSKVGEAKTYVYLFTHGMPGNDPASQGAFHTADVPYWLGHFSSARQELWTDVDYMVGDTMSDFLVSLAATGDPQAEGLPAWSAFDSEAPVLTYMELGDEISEKSFDEAKTTFWKAWYAGI